MFYQFLNVFIFLFLDIKTYTLGQEQKSIDSGLTSDDYTERPNYIDAVRETHTPSPEWRQALQMAGLQLAATPTTQLNWKGLFCPAPSDNPTHTYKALNFTALLVKHLGSTCLSYISVSTVHRFKWLTELIKSECNPNPINT